MDMRPLCCLAHHLPLLSVVQSASSDPVDPEALMNEPLSLTCQITVQLLENDARVNALPDDEFNLFERVEEIGDASCDYCIEIDGMIISRDDPDFDVMCGPMHINCDGIVVGIGSDETGSDGQPMEPDYERPPEEMVEKFAHFVADPDRYAPLRIPAQPEGRDFIARAVVDKNGNRRLKLDWRIEPYDLPGR